MINFHFIFILLVLIGLACAVVWAAGKILAALNVIEPFRTIVYVIIVLACIFAVADYALGGGLSGGHTGF